MPFPLALQNCSRYNKEEMRINETMHRAASSARKHHETETSLMQTMSLSIHTDHEIRKQAEMIFNELGLPLPAAIDIFLRASVRAKGMPFALSLDDAASETRLAIEEGRRLADDPNVKGYKSMAELKAALEA